MQQDNRLLLFIRRDSTADFVIDIICNRTTGFVIDRRCLLCVQEHRDATGQLALLLTEGVYCVCRNIERAS